MFVFFVCFQTHWIIDKKWVQKHDTNEMSSKTKTFTLFIYFFLIVSITNFQNFKFRDSG